MWPFKKKPEPSFINITGFTERRMMSWEDVEALGRIGAKTLSTWAELKRQRREEKKMKLIEGHYYEMTNGFIVEAKLCKECKDAKVFLLHGVHFSEDGRIQDPHGRGISGTVVREAPAPLRLEVGALYEMSSGPICRCQNYKYPAGERLYALGPDVYKEDGTPFCDSSAPRPKYKLRVNEPVSTGGSATGNRGKPTKSVDQMIEDGDLAPYIIYSDDKMDAMLYGLWGKDFFKEARAMYKERAKSAPSYTDTIRDRYVEPIPVTYRNIHHDDEPCERDVAVPEGYEQVPYGQMKRGDLYPNHDYWDTAGDSRIECANRNGELGGLFIRPKKAFKVDGAGWYKSNTGWQYISINRVMFFQNERHISGDTRLVAKATAEQAAILDAL